MQWSKTKTALEGFLCDKLKGRVRLYATVYRKYHDGPARVWITFDKKEILSGSDVTYMMNHQKLYRELEIERQLKPIPYHPDFNFMYYSKEREELVQTSNDTEQIMIRKGIFLSFHLYEPFLEYPSLPIDEIMNSENIIIQAYSMFDKRIGKRRLKDIHLAEDSHPLVKRFFKIRCEVEGIEN